MSKDIGDLLEEYQSTFNSTFSTLAESIKKSVEELNEELEPLKTENSSLLEEISNNKSKLIEIEEKIGNELKSTKEERDSYKLRYEQADEKIKHIENQLQSTMSQLDDITKEQKKELDTLKLLDVYLVLMNQVFAAASHVRLLVILHGDKDEYSIEELAKASGYPILQTKKTIFELRNNQIVEFDEDRNTVKLMSRFM